MNTNELCTECHHPAAKNIPIRLVETVEESHTAQQRLWHNGNTDTELNILFNQIEKPMSPKAYTDLSER